MGGVADTPQGETPTSLLANRISDTHLSPWRVRKTPPSFT